MKKVLILLALCGNLCTAFAISPVSTSPAPVNASTLMIPVGNDGKTISLQELANMKPREYAKMANRDMNLVDRISFSIAQKKLRNSIDADGTLNVKHAQKLAKALDGETGFHFGGFALGFFLGLIGILIAYLIKDDYRSNRRKWAWIGFGIFLVLYIALIAALM